MKQFSKIYFVFLLAMALALTFSAAAQETTTQVPQEWIDEYIEKFPNSETAIIMRYPDMPNDWSTDALVKAVQNGLINGSDGYILPKEHLTRAQLATILVRAFGATKAADVSEFADLSPDKWYYNAMATAVEMGIFRGDGSGNLRPDDSITRQEIFTVVSRAFNLTGADPHVLAEFPDKDLVADWAKDATASLISGKYINGADGYINPTRPITRAEFAQMMKNLVDTYIVDEGVYTEITGNNVVIRAAGVVLDGVKLSGNLYIGEGAGDSITLSSVTSPFRVIVRGGTSAVFTGTFKDVSVVGKGLTVNLSQADVQKYSTVNESVIVAPTDNSSESQWGTAADDSLQNDTPNNPSNPKDKDGDGWTDGWH